MKKIKRRINKFKVLRFIVIVLLIFVTIGLGINKFFNNKKSTDNNTKLDKDESQIYEASMIMVGDNLIHDSIYEEAKIKNGGKGYDFSSMYEFIKPIVCDYDIAYYNQETILGGSDIGVSSYPSFNSPYEVGDAMIDAGFNLVSLATNHTLDRGQGAVLNSRSYWNKQTNILAVGSYASFDEKNQVQVREVNNISYTMLNYTYGTNGINVPSGKEYLVNIWPVTGNNPEVDVTYQEYKKQIKEDIEKVRAKVDVLIVAMHWGVEYQDMPNSYQIDAASYLASLGVDIIIGTHPHVIQPVDYIDDTLVIYSLGNFLSAHEVVNMANRVGLMTSLDITKDSKTGKVMIDNVENELLYTYYTSDYTDFKVIPFSQINNNYLDNYKDIYLKYKNIVTKLNKDINVVSLD